MKKSGKQILMILLSVVLVLTFTFPASASTNVITKDNHGLEMFTSLCDAYYPAHTEYVVFDKNNNNISDSYYINTVDLYEKNEIEALYNYSKTVVSYFKKTTITNESSTRGAIQSVSQTETFFAYSTDGVDCPDFEMVYTLNGRFSYNTNTGVITSHYGPTITITDCSLVGFWSWAMTQASTSAKLSTDKRRITFKGQFKVHVELEIPLGNIGIPGVSETVGPYYAEFITYGT